VKMVAKPSLPVKKSQEDLMSATNNCGSAKAMTGLVIASVRSTTPPLHRIARRSAREAIEGIEQPLAPGVDGIVRFKQVERAHHARPLKSAEHDVVSVVRCLAAEIGLALQRDAHRLQRFAERDDGRVA